MGKRRSITSYQTGNLDMPVSMLEIKVSNSKNANKKQRPTRENRESGESQSLKNIDSTLKVNVYIQLEGIQNVPNRLGDIVLELSFNNKIIPKLEQDCCGSNVVVVNSDFRAATFSFQILQDSVSDLNNMSDHPVIVILYEQVIKSQEEKEQGYEGEEEEVTERVVVGQGYIDLLGYFSKRRFSAHIETFIYPPNKEDQLDVGTCKAKWHIYTLLPLLKNAEFSNTVFLNFESIYNPSTELLEICDELMADVAFRALVPNEKKEFVISKICSFSGFTPTVIRDQNTFFKWEAVKMTADDTKESFGFQSDNKVNIYKLFKRVLRPEGVDMDFKEIDMEVDEALVCNSMHRYVLNDALRTMLEEVFVFRQQELVLRIYKASQPATILLEGTVDPSVLLYPFVNAVRFAVALNPVQVQKKPKSMKKSKTDSVLSGDSSPKLQFAIISVCFLTPITEKQESLVKYTEGSQREKLKNCRRLQSETLMAPIPFLAEKAYADYDDWVDDIVTHIIKNNIHEISDAKNFFCCQLENGTNRILKLIALDFNRRFPTTNNIEFTKLMTTVYKELVDRAYSNIKKCSSKSLRQCLKAEHETLSYIISLMDIIKLSNECGNTYWCNFFTEKLQERYPKNTDLSFYEFLFATERGQFEEAQNYIKKPLKERRLLDEDITRIIAIYIDYMQNSKKEEKDTLFDAFEKLLTDLRDFLKLYRKNIDIWILLYCLYKVSGYKPGMEFTRWHFEDLCGPHRELKNVPISRWRIYCDYKLECHTPRGILFYSTVELFESIGAYKFAEFVIAEIASDCSEAEHYLHTTTLKILLNEVNENTIQSTFPTIHTPSLNAFLLQVNGNLAYYREEMDIAKDNYEGLVDIEKDDLIPNSFQISLRRYANKMMEEENYEKAMKAYKECCNINTCVVSCIYLGISLYKLGRLEEAEQYFSHCTEYRIHLPNVWGYLALINLRLGRNFNALECWKYAKLNPETVIDDEIIQELNKIDFRDVNLYVDKPV